MANSTYLSDQIISTYFTASTVYISEHTNDPGMSGANEVSSGIDANYARQEATLAKTLDGNVYRARNTADISFPAAGGGASYTVKYLGIWTEASGGNLLATLALAGSGVPVVAGGINTIAVNDIVVRGE